MTGTEQQGQIRAAPPPIADVGPPQVLQESLSLFPSDLDTDESETGMWSPTLNFTHPTTTELFSTQKLPDFVKQVEEAEWRIAIAQPWNFQERHDPLQESMAHYTLAQRYRKAASSGEALTAMSRAAQIIAQGLQRAPSRPHERSPWHHITPHTHMRMHRLIWDHSCPTHPHSTTACLPGLTIGFLRLGGPPGPVPAGAELSRGDPAKRQATLDRARALVTEAQLVHLVPDVDHAQAELAQDTGDFQTAARLFASQFQHALGTGAPALDPAGWLRVGHGCVRAAGCLCALKAFEAAAAFLARARALAKKYGSASLCEEADQQREGLLKARAQHQLEQHAASAAAGGAAGSAPLEEDWDAEMEAEEQHQKAAVAGTTHMRAEYARELLNFREGRPVPGRFRVLDEATLTSPSPMAPVTAPDPPPSRLFSLHSPWYATPGAAPPSAPHLQSAAGQVEWLGRLVAAHEPFQAPLCSAATVEERYVVQFTSAWAGLYYEAAQQAFRDLPPQACWDMLSHYFRTVWDRPRRDLDELDEDELADHHQFFVTSVLLLQLAGRLVGTAPSAMLVPFQRMVQVCLELHPQYQDLVRLVEARAIAHWANVLGPSICGRCVPLYLHVYWRAVRALHRPPAALSPPAPALLLPSASPLTAAPAPPLEGAPAPRPFSTAPPPPTLRAAGPGKQPAPSPTTAGSMPPTATTPTPTTPAPAAPPATRTPAELTPTYLAAAALTGLHMLILGLSPLTGATPPPAQHWPQAGRHETLDHPPFSCRAAGAARGATWTSAAGARFAALSSEEKETASAASASASRMSRSYRPLGRHPSSGSSSGPTAGPSPSPGQAASAGQLTLRALLGSAAARHIRAALQQHRQLQQTQAGAGGSMGSRPAYGPAALAALFHQRVAGARSHGGPAGGEEAEEDDEPEAGSPGEGDDRDEDDEDVGLGDWWGSDGEEDAPETPVSPPSSTRTPRTPPEEAPEASGAGGGRMWSSSSAGSLSTTASTTASAASAGGGPSSASSPSPSLAAPAEPPSGGGSLLLAMSTEGPPGAFATSSSGSGSSSAGPTLQQLLSQTAAPAEKPRWVTDPSTGRVVQAASPGSHRRRARSAAAPTALSPVADRPQRSQQNHHHHHHHHHRPHHRADHRAQSPAAGPAGGPGMRGEEGGLGLLLADPEQRIERLYSLYGMLEATPLKALMAYGLALAESRFRQDAETAESLLFEGLALLDQLGGPPRAGLAFPPVISDLGASCLLHYGDVCALQDKLPLAVAAWEAALSCCTLMRRTEDVHALARPLAKLCASNEDIPRALRYYGRVLETCRSESHESEALYVRELMAELHLRQGNFAGAAQCIDEALAGCRFTPQRVHLHLLLARICDQGGAPARGVSLLQRLAAAVAGAEVPFEVRAEVTLTLVRALVRRRWLSEAMAALRRLGAELASIEAAALAATRAAAPSSTPRHRRQASTASTGSYQSSGGSASERGAAKGPAAPAPVSAYPNLMRDGHGAAAASAEWTGVWDDGLSGAAVPTYEALHQRMGVLAARIYHHSGPYAPAACAPGGSDGRDGKWRNGLGLTALLTLTHSLVDGIVSVWYGGVVCYGLGWAGLLDCSGGRAGQYLKALAWIDHCVRTSHETQLAHLGRLFMARGKALEQLSLPSCPLAVPLNPVPVWAPQDLAPPPAPLTASPTAPGLAAPAGTKIYACPDRHSADPTQPAPPQPPVGGGSSFPSIVYRDSASLLAACLASYEKGREYFQMVGDLVASGRAALAMCRAHLGRLFPASALMQHVLADLARLPDMGEARMVEATLVLPSPALTAGPPMPTTVLLEVPLVPPLPQPRTGSLAAPGRLSGGGRGAAGAMSASTTSSSGGNTSISSASGASALSLPAPSPPPPPPPPPPAPAPQAAPSPGAGVGLTAITNKRLLDDLASIERLACVGLDVGACLGEPFMVLDGLVSMAELRYLQGRLHNAATFWVEARDTVFRLFMAGPHCLLPRTAPPSLRRRLFPLQAHLTCVRFGPSGLRTRGGPASCPWPAQHVALIDAYLLLQQDMGPSLRTLAADSPELDEDPGLGAPPEVLLHPPSAGPRAAQQPPAARWGGPLPPPGSSHTLMATTLARPPGGPLAGPGASHYLLKGRRERELAMRLHEDGAATAPALSTETVPRGGGPLPRLLAGSMAARVGSGARSLSLVSSSVALTVSASLYARRHSGTRRMLWGAGAMVPFPSMVPPPEPVAAPVPSSPLTLQRVFEPPTPQLAAPRRAGPAAYEADQLRMAGGDPAAAGAPAEEDEEADEEAAFTALMSGLLFLCRDQVRRFSEGRLSQERCRLANLNCLRRMHEAVRPVAPRAAPVARHGSPPSSPVVAPTARPPLADGCLLAPHHTPYDALFDGHNTALARVAVALHIEDLVIIYIPATGARQVLRFGGRTEPILTGEESGSGSISGGLPGSTGALSAASSGSLPTTVPSAASGAPPPACPALLPGLPSPATPLSPSPPVTVRGPRSPTTTADHPAAPPPPQAPQPNPPSPQGAPVWSKYVERDDEDQDDGAALGLPGAGLPGATAAPAGAAGTAGADADAELDEITLAVMDLQETGAMPLPPLPRPAPPRPPAAKESPPAQQPAPAWAKYIERDEEPDGDFLTLDGPAAPRPTTGPVLTALPAPPPPPPPSTTQAGGPLSGSSGGEEEPEEWAFASSHTTSTELPTYADPRVTAAAAPTDDGPAAPLPVRPPKLAASPLGLGAAAAAEPPRDADGFALLDEIPTTPPGTLPARAGGPGAPLPPPRSTGGRAGLAPLSLAPLGGEGGREAGASGGFENTSPPMYPSPPPTVRVRDLSPTATEPPGSRWDEVEPPTGSPAPALTQGNVELVQFGGPDGAGPQPADDIDWAAFGLEDLPQTLPPVVAPPPPPAACLPATSAGVLGEAEGDVGGLSLDRYRERDDEGDEDGFADLFPERPGEQQRMPGGAATRAAPSAGTGPRSSRPTVAVHGATAHTPPDTGALAPFAAPVGTPPPGPGPALQQSQQQQQQQSPCDVAAYHLQRHLTLRLLGSAPGGGGGGATSSVAAGGQAAHSAPGPAPSFGVSSGSATMLTGPLAGCSGPTTTATTATSAAASGGGGGSAHSSAERMAALTLGPSAAPGAPQLLGAWGPPLRTLGCSTVEPATLGWLARMAGLEREDESSPAHLQPISSTPTPHHTTPHHTTPSPVSLSPALAVRRPLPTFLLAAGLCWPASLAPRPAPSLNWARPFRPPCCHLVGAQAFRFPSSYLPALLLGPPSLHPPPGQPWAGAPPSLALGPGSGNVGMNMNMGTGTVPMAAMTMPLPLMPPSPSLTSLPPLVATAPGSIPPSPRASYSERVALSAVVGGSATGPLTPHLMSLAASGPSPRLMRTPSSLFLMQTAPLPALAPAPAPSPPGAQLAPHALAGPVSLGLPKHFPGWLLPLGPRCPLLLEPPERPPPALVVGPEALAWSPWLVEVVRPLPEKQRRALAHHFLCANPPTHLPAVPLLLVCSRSLQLIPWELLAGQLGARVLSLLDAVERYGPPAAPPAGAAQPQPPPEGPRAAEQPPPARAEGSGEGGTTATTSASASSTPRAVTVQCVALQATEDPTLVQIREEMRCKAALAEAFHALRLDPQPVSLTLQRRLIPALPYHSPLLKYCKPTASLPAPYRKNRVRFIEISARGGAADLVTLIDNHKRLEGPHTYMAFVLPLADLVDLPLALLALLSYRTDCPVLFVPAARMRTAVHLLNRLRDGIAPLPACPSAPPTDLQGLPILTPAPFPLYPPLRAPACPGGRRGPEGVTAYQQLCSAVAILQWEYRIPVVLFNPPLPGLL
ncbi:hypothetical protein PAPYR_1492 [Paratrimastix pyriformis]|uniref:Uncharacterized protein n=1 Tax=Paratrimastix pyriformis TaxID=342808 RepID=A0ABQ8UW80_9EUKA|nr:hypothetical protein PAPYR_1492 [Paratrimastix pyriformis]